MLFNNILQNLPSPLNVVLSEFLTKVKLFIIVVVVTPLLSLSNIEFITGNPHTKLSLICESLVEINIVEVSTDTAIVLYALN